MKPQLVAKLNIKIEQDWNLLRNLAVNESKSMMNTSVDTKEFTIKQYAENHSISYQGHLSDYWTIHSGDLLKEQLPWYQNFLEAINPLQYDGIGYSRTGGDIEEHADSLGCYSDSGVQHVLVPEGQCKINFVIHAEDSDSITVVTDRDDATNSKIYGADPEVAWLVDINHPHYVKCNGPREVLSFKFCEKFDTVFEHFNSLGHLHFK